MLYPLTFIAYQLPRSSQVLGIISNTAITHASPNPHVPLESQSIYSFPLKLGQVDTQLEYLKRERGRVRNILL